MRFNPTDILYEENGKKNIYKWTRKNFLIKILISSTNEFQHGLFKISKYENFK